MPIIEPAKFTATKASGTARKFIISLTDGTTTWLIGNFSAIWTDGTVYHLIDTFSLPSSSDLFENVDSRATMPLTVNNMPTYYKEGIRISDEIQNIVAKTAVLYVTADDNTSQLADCLPIARGAIRNITNVNLSTLTITWEDLGYVFDKVVLTTQIRDLI